MFSRLFGALPARAAKRSPRAPLFVERLEDRLTPTVTAINGTVLGAPTLFLKGDAGDDNLVISEGASPGTFTVVGGSLNNVFTNVTNIRVNLDGGVDQSVTYIGSGAGSLAGVFGVSEASTNSFSLTIDNGGNIAGPVLYDPNGVGATTVNLGIAGGATTNIGDVTIYEGPAACTVNVNDITMGYLSANFNAGGTSTVRAGNSAAVNMGFLSVVNKSTASQNDVFVGTTAAVSIAGNVRIVDGLNGDFSLQRANVTGYVSFNAPNATTACTVNLPNLAAGGLTIGGFLSIVTGAGADQIILGRYLTIGQNLTIVTNDNADFINFVSITVGGNTNIDTGDGNDDVFLDGQSTSDDVNTVFNGIVSIQLGAGDDDIDYGFDANDAAQFNAGAVVNGGPAAGDTSTDKALSDAVSPVDAIEINIP